MVRTSIFVICSFATCLKRLLVLSLALSIVYFILSSFTFPPNWFNFDEYSTTEYRSHLGVKKQFNNMDTYKRSKNISKLTQPEFDVPNKNNNDNWDYLMTQTNAAHFSKSFIDFIKTSPHKYQAQLLCPTMEENSLLIGHVGQAPLLIEELEEWEVEKANSDLRPGGNWKPANCQARYKVAIVIPYRDRKTHLVRLLDFLIPLLKKQFLDFRFIVAEQNGENLFNKGRVMNAAFLFGHKQLNVDCLIFHDVDMFPQDDRTPYECPTHGPRHVGAFVGSLGYQLWYQEIVGGVLAINVQDFLKVNGFSNSYWAWGGEDDDMGKRILSHNFTIDRPNGDFVRFSMLKHVKRKRIAPKLVYKLLEETEKRMDIDGVNESNKWKILKVDARPLYYHLLVDVGNPPTEWKS